MSIDKVVVSEKTMSVLKTEDHCSWYLCSTTPEGFYTNPTRCKNCDGLDENCLIYQEILQFKELKKYEVLK